MSTGKIFRSAKILFSNPTVDITYHLLKISLSVKYISLVFYLKIIIKNWSGFKQKSFVMDPFSNKWNDIVFFKKKGIGQSFSSFFDTFDSILDRHAEHKTV